MEENTNVETTAEVQETNGAEPEKTFTQSELDAIVADRIARERKKMPSDIDMKDYREWKKNKQTEAERIAELEAQLNAANSEIAYAKNMQTVSKAECKPEFAEFVADRVSKMEGDFEKNLTAYKKANPQYFGEAIVRTVSTSPRMSGGSVSGQSADEIMNNILRSARK